ncbi:MAG: hypothetical protein ACREML_03325 [Vulcanimicrobiaceae bacterium]
MKRIVVALLLVALPSVAFAQRDRSGGGSRAPQPVSRPAPPPATVNRPQPQAHVAPPANQGGFNFNHDVNPRVPLQPPVRQQLPVRAPQPVVRKQPPPQHRPVRVPQPVARGFHGSRVHNPHAQAAPWNWNRGVAWAPAPIYWGGGFWGPWAFADISTAILFGSVTDSNNDDYQSYQVEPNSAGAQLLADYGLQQTPCGPPNLVVIWGPDDSVICAFPNAMVGPGNYQLDPSTLTLVSQ